MRTSTTLLAAVLVMAAGRASAEKGETLIDPYMDTGAGATEEPTYVDNQYTYEQPAADDLTPQDAIGYSGGRKKKIKIITVNYEVIELATGKAFIEMREAARADGVELWFYSGYRSMDQQKWLYQKYKAGYGHKAAKPGYSNHQMGRAMDVWVGEPGTYDWLEQNAKRFGFQRTVPGEPWHWEYKGKPKAKKSKKKKHH